MVGRQPRRLAFELKAVVARTELNAHFVLHGHGLHDRPEVVVTIGTTIENAKDEIDFGRSGNGEFGGC
jgi:hypothetical protein